MGRSQYLNKLMSDNKWQVFDKIFDNIYPFIIDKNSATLGFNEEAEPSGFFDQNDPGPFAEVSIPAAHHSTTNWPKRSNSTL